MIKLYLAAVLVSSSLGGIASAQDFSPDVHVGYRDLDLGEQADVKRLDRRIARAVAEVCPDGGTLDVGVQVAIRHCRRAKLAEVAVQRARVLAAAQPAKLMTASTR